MKLLSLALISSFSLSAFALYPVGHYSGRCEQTSAMQEWKNGKKVGKPDVSPGYTLQDLIVTQDGEDVVMSYKSKLFIKNGPNGFEYDFAQKAHMISESVERRTDLKDGSYADYRIEDDGTMTWIGGATKDGKPIKSMETTSYYVTEDKSAIVGMMLDNVGAPVDSKFTGWAYAGAKMWCRMDLVN